MFINPKARAFTIMEVMLALGILVLLAGSIFAIMEASVSAVGRVTEQQKRARTYFGLTELCRKTFRTLPSSATVEGGVYEEDGKYYSRVIIRQSPRAFAWGENTRYLGESILSARPQLGGLYSFGLLRQVEEGTQVTLSETPRWLILARDIRDIRWRFYDPRTTQWQEDWKDPSLHPSLVELSLTPAGETEPIRSIFWLPPLGAHEPMKTPFSSRANRGSALLLVLWATVMLSVMVMGVVHLVDFDLDDSIGRQKNARARQLAECGLALGIHPEVEFHDPVLRQTLPNAERIEVKISSEGARLNINRLFGRNDRELLRRIFDEWGLDDTSSSRLLDCLADWVDTDDMKRLNGAERSDYEKGGVPAAPKNHPFWSLEEMAMVSGMEELEKVKPNWRDYFTIWGDGRLDINEASAELIHLVCEVNILQAEALVKRRWGPDGKEGTEDDIRYTDMEEVRRTLALPQPLFERIDQRITIQENVRRVESTGIVGNHRYRIILVALRNANPPQYLEWQEP